MDNSEKNNQLNIKNWKVYLILMLVSALGFYQILFYIHPVKWDMIDCFLPWRYHVGECLQNGELPVWNPYVFLGTPISADPSSGAWYPLTWLFGYFKGYSVFIIGFELWLHVFLAGIGFYKLAKTFGLAPLVALLAGMAYMLSGLFVGNAQHLPYIISACWLPFILNHYILFLKDNKWKDVIIAAFAMYLSITGGYPAFTIILSYLMLMFFFYFLIKTEKRKGNVKQFLLKNVAFTGLSLLASIPMLLSVYQAVPFMTRMVDFPVEKALFSPFSPQSFISFIYPYATTLRGSYEAYFDADLSMRNAYFSGVILALFLFGMFRKKTVELNVVFWFGLFALTASVGSYLPVREFLFNYIPMMSVFRFPSVFRLFFIIAAILTGLYFLQNLLLNEFSNKKKSLIVYLGACLLVLVLVFHFSLNVNAFNIADYISNQLFVVSETAGFWKNIAVQSIVQVILFLSLILIVWRMKNVKKIVVSIIVVIAIDLIAAAQLNGPSTIYSHEWTAEETGAKLANLKRGFPLPDSSSILQNDTEFYLGQPYWKNLSVFSKKIGSTGFNSFIFSSYSDLESNQNLFNALIKNKPVLLTSAIFSKSSMETFEKDSSFTSNQVFVSEKDFQDLSAIHLSHSPDDKYRFNEFSPTSFKISTQTQNKQVLVLFQKNYTPWSACINGKPTRMFLANNNFMSIVLPGGKNEVVFQYQNKSLHIAIWISISIHLAMFISLLFFIRADKHGQNE